MNTKKFSWFKFVLLIYLPFFYLCLFLPLFLGENRSINLLASLFMSLFGLIITPAIFGLLPFAIIFSSIDAIGLLKTSWQRIIFGAVLGASLYLVIYLIVGHDKIIPKVLSTEFVKQMAIMLFVHGLAVWTIYVFPKLIKILVAHVE